MHLLANITLSEKESREEGKVDWGVRLIVKKIGIFADICIAYLQIYGHPRKSGSLIKLFSTCTPTIHSRVF